MDILRWTRNDRVGIAMGEPSLCGSRRDNGQPRRTTSAPIPLPRTKPGPGALLPGPGSPCAAPYAARSMAGSQPVSASSSAARAAMSPFLNVAMFSAAFAFLPSVTASIVSGFHTPF